MRSSYAPCIPTAGLALDGDDTRSLPLSLRKTNLARLPDGTFVAPYKTGEIGPDLFRNARKPRGRRIEPLGTPSYSQGYRSRNIR
jgi:hypothetical protein